MTEQVRLCRLYDKARHLAKECNIDYPRNSRDVEAQCQAILLTMEEAIKCLISNRTQNIPLRSLDEQYYRLECHVQKLQSDVRRHIGAELQLKLFNDSLQQQLIDSQDTRMQFLESTRILIADLKKKNQILHEYNNNLRSRENQLRSSVKSMTQQTEVKKKQSDVVRTENSKERSPSQKFGSYLPKNLNNHLDIKVSAPYRYKQQPNSDKRKSKKVFESSSYQYLYTSNIDIQHSYQRRPKKRSLKKSSLSSRYEGAVDSEEITKKLS